MQERRGDTAKRGDPVTENAEGVRSFLRGKRWYGSMLSGPRSANLHVKPDPGFYSGCLNGGTAGTTA
jgi:hypothetical protein